MKHFEVLALMATTALLINLTACEKEGPAGPAGTQGEQGTAGTNGEAGPKGDKGDKGDKGTANVIYSDWLGVDFDAIGGGGSGYKGTINSSKITTTILNDGEVTVYMKLKAAPYIVYKLNYIENIYWVNMGMSVGKIDMTSNYNAGSLNNFRYVIIPGGVHSRALADGLDFNNYEEVAEAFNIAR